MIIGFSTLELHLPGVGSLKEKRGILKSLMAQIRKKFNVAVAEVDLHDVWQSGSIGLSVVSTSASHAETMLENIAGWIETYRPDIDIIEQRIETLRA